MKVRTIGKMRETNILASPNLLIHSLALSVFSETLWLFHFKISILTKYPSQYEKSEPLKLPRAPTKTISQKFKIPWAAKNPETA